VIEPGMQGFQRGRNLEKLRMHGQGTAELFFDVVRVPVDNLLGELGQGFRHLTRNLAQERLSMAISGVASARAALDWRLATSRSARRSASRAHARVPIARTHADARVTRIYGGTTEIMTEIVGRSMRI
jgi:alkylation response protein AidB-like acyl-CoA dehydrogenase